MITPSPREYSYLEVNRPISGADAEQFVAGVREVGRRVLGEEVITSISELALPDLDDGTEIASPQTVVTPVTQPILKVSDAEDLSMVLLHRGVPHDLSSRYDIAYNALRLMRPVERYEQVEDDEGVQHRAEVTYPPLRTVLKEVSEMNGLDPDATDVVCDAVCIMVEPGDDYILALTPKTTGRAARALHEQAKECHQRLQWQSRRLAQPVSGSMIGVPFARMPQKVTHIESDRIIGGIQHLLPRRFIMAEPRVRTGD
ncbi:MAG TPA: hypothetical protein VK983_02600 [Candidatus Limnocylindrales bacterium]|nr:hypothetical protein [Candidatus Limnocylindrales bacterium]